AAAGTTGDESGLSRETLDAMRASNLAHILSISGLHMALVTGFVFVTLRSALALVPPVALRLNTKKLAALVALTAATGYLAISGMDVATQRSYIMAAVMLVGVLLDRRALTLRAVALSALIVLALMPEALMGPGFQMSYAATVALVWFFALLRDHRPTWLPRWAGGAVTLVLSSLVAGLATAPFAAAHFNQTTRYGLIANLLAAPFMGRVVMPGAVVAAVLAPLGLAPLGLVPMGWGAEAVLEIARRVAGLSGAVRFVVQPPAAVLPLLVLGAIWLMLWQGRLRWGGAAAVALALALWQQAGRPEVLVSGDGGLVGVMTPAGRALSREKGQGFVAQSWLENDGTDRDRAAAWARGTVWMDAGALVWEADGIRLAALFSPKPGPLARDCARSSVVVTNRAVPAAARDEVPGPCVILDPVALKDSGPLAIWRAPDGLGVRSVREAAGHRLWNDRTLRETGHPGRSAEGRTEAALRAALNRDRGAGLRPGLADPQGAPGGPGPETGPLQPPAAMAGGDAAELR
ncbi:MAG: ComEC/Rec2 family competence protein, partial [Mangrovicoccus sp.]|nr:ComEC/Rec2 family competence protein [Mangrovicoccus sp.]